MKKRSRPLYRHWIINTGSRLGIFFFSAISAPALALVATAAVTALAPGTARATQELDRQYFLETIGALKSWDNVDGLFAEYVSTAYKDYFSRQSRFILQDLSKADAILSGSKLPYYKLIEDTEILGQIARSLRAESLIRTKVYKEGASYRFVMDWMHSPKMELIASESFTLEEPRDGKSIGIGDVRGSVQTALDRLIKKLPFSATITGRDNQSVTVNIGDASGLKKGDTLKVATVDEVKKHPLLKSIVDWRLTETGRVVIEEVDERIAFGKVIEEEPGREIQRFQKVVQIIPKPIPEAPPILREQDERERNLNAPPTLGWGMGGLWVGGFSRTYSSLNGTSGRTGGGMFLGAKADGQLWLTRDWFAELGAGFGFSGYSQKDIQTGQDIPTSGGGPSVISMKIAGGYTYYTSGDLFGPKAWVKLGYRSTSYSMPSLQADFLAPVSFKGLFLGVGGDLPIRDAYGAILTLDVGFVTSASETGNLSGSVTGASDVEFFIGGYYRFAPRLKLRAGLDVMIQGADFETGANLTHRIITVGPSLVYYF